MSAQNGLFELLSTTNQMSYTQTDSIISGNYYSFKVIAINLVGKSSFSNEITVLAA